MTADLVRRTLSLCRDLRGRGMTVTTAHAIDALVEVLGAVEAIEHDLRDLLRLLEPGSEER